MGRLAEALQAALIPSVAAPNVRQIARRASRADPHEVFLMSDGAAETLHTRRCRISQTAVSFFADPQHDGDLSSQAPSTADMRSGSLQRGCYTVQRSSSSSASVHHMRTSSSFSTYQQPMSSPGGQPTSLDPQSMSLGEAQQILEVPNGAPRPQLMLQYRMKMLANSPYAGGEPAERQKIQMAYDALLRDALSNPTAGDSKTLTAYEHELHEKKDFIQDKKILDALAVAANAKAKAREDAQESTRPAFLAIREAADAAAQAEKIRYSVKRAEAVALAAKRWKDLSLDVFLGIPPRLQEITRSFVEDNMIRQAPKAPLYLPPTISFAPQLDDTPIPHLPQLQFQDM